MSTYIVIPAYNEEKSIAKVIEQLLDYNYKNIVVVDDGSTDKTAQIAQQYPVIVIEHVVNLGQGAALQTAHEYALEMKAEKVIHFDADGQHQVEEIEKFIKAIDDGYEVVLGSRFLEKNKTVPFSKKYFILKPAILINWLFTGLKLSDAHNGFRAMRNSALQKIRLTQPGMAHATEITEQINRHKLKYLEVPVEIKYNQYGQGVGSGLKILFDLLKKSFLN